MISILLSSRTKDNRDSNIIRLLDTLIKYTSNIERDCIEVLIKCDEDDDKFNLDVRKYQLNIKTFITERCEGKLWLHHFYEFLFMKRNYNSRFIMIPSDDIYFTRNNFISEILATKEVLCTIPFKCDDNNLGFFRGAKCYYGFECVVASVTFFEICQSFGFEPATDMWIGVLNYLLYDKYKLNLRIPISRWHARDSVYGDMGRGCDYYNNMIPSDKMWLRMIEQQAETIKLTAYKNNLVTVKMF